MKMKTQEQTTNLQTLLLKVDPKSPFYRVCRYSLCLKPFHYTKPNQVYCCPKCQQDDYNYLRSLRKVMEKENSDNHKKQTTDEELTILPDEKSTVDPIQEAFNSNMSLLGKQQIAPGTSKRFKFEDMEKIGFHFDIYSYRVLTEETDSGIKRYFVMLGNYKITRINQTIIEITLLLNN